MIANPEDFVTADYVNIIVGETLAERYNPPDVVELAETINADIITVGDSAQMLPDGDATDSYLGSVDDNLDTIHAADAYLVVGVDIQAATDVPWAAFTKNGMLMTHRSAMVYRDAVEEIPFNSWVQNAKADTLSELVRDVSELTARTDVATIYSEDDDHPDPPAHLQSEYDTTREVKQCEICHTLSNHRVAIGSGYPGTAKEWRCPAIAHRNHDRLETLLEQREKVRKQQRTCDTTSESGQRKHDRHDTEHARLTEKIQTIRSWFDGRFDDVVAKSPDIEDVEEFEPSKLRYQ